MGRGLTLERQESLLHWAAPRLRDLPWRATRDPWAVLVSEVMLQQTGVRRVAPKWAEFMEAFPTVHDCAAAALGDVLRMWQGLGYPRRARNLHAAAGRIVTQWNGEVPTDLEQLLSLPGVGPYTARAVLAFAHEIDVAVVDTNVARVLSRHEGRRLRPKEVQLLADS
ncbi:MAG: A/G-specific adenine glycosylase, partial [Actinomycetota bacterium]